MPFGRVAYRLTYHVCTIYSILIVTTFAEHIQATSVQLSKAGRSRLNIGAAL